MMPLRWKLKEIAEPERWTARKLSQKTGLAYNTVWGIWANKTRRADLDTLERLARALNIPATALIDDTPSTDESNRTT